jgi:alkanesulfonate monooxygenase SsuD/methylene tetrahydromethanopterin reductase-like flavin-dependent oxidoreductase (luciferase family)
VVEAEHLGAGSVWVTEHHRFPDGYLPQPLVLAAAIAARTRAIRIGTAIVQAPLRHPVHLAEEMAVVDLVSGGRLEVGLGAGYSVDEFRLFGADLDRRFGTTDATFEAVRRLLDEDGITPPPLQRPFPLWLGYHGPRNARRAGRLGAGLLDLKPEVVAPYLEGLAEGGHDPSSARVAGVVDVIVADDPERAWQRVAPHYLFQLNTYRQARGRRELTVEDLGDRHGAGLGPEIAVRLAVLTVEEAAELFHRRIAGLPVAHVYTWATIAGMPDDLVHRHLELLLGAVQPALDRLNR